MISTADARNIQFQIVTKRYERERVTSPLGDPGMCAVCGWPRYWGGRGRVCGNWECSAHGQPVLFPVPADYNPQPPDWDDDGGCDRLADDQADAYFHAQNSRMAGVQ
jgi:hypothetical protein